MNKMLVIAVGAAVLGFGSVALAQFEAHPHLMAAHEKIEAAVQELRTANDGKKEYGGHRDRAEALLIQAQGEIKAAAEFANSHH
jgi:hypothetical protein